jgi:hypothetical protein
VEGRRIDRAAAGSDGERARRVAEERQHRERRAAERRAEARRVEDPDVGAADAGRRELRIAGPVLPTVRRRDERAVPSLAREHDVARLVADEQRPHDARRGRPDVDDAHAVGEVVHHPHLGVRSSGDRHQLEPDRHGRRVRQVAVRVDGAKISR